MTEKIKFFKKGSKREINKTMCVYVSVSTGYFVYCGIWITSMQHVNSIQEGTIFLASKDSECIGALPGVLLWTSWFQAFV